MNNSIQDTQYYCRTPQQDTQTVLKVDEGMSVQYRQSDRQTDLQTDRKTDIQRQTHTYTDIQR